MTATVQLNPFALTLDDVLAVARAGAAVEIPAEVLGHVAACRRDVEALASSPRPVYGVSTGFGALAQKHIPAEKRTQLQKSLVRSHAAGMGDPVEREVVRALMLLRAKTLATARTGARPLVLETMVAVLNAGITPVVREYGSLGCSGDLAPLAHCALVLMGEGEASGPDGELADTAALLADAGIEPIVLEEKEGLALINGTDGMLGMLLMAIADLRMLLATADVSASLSIEGLYGTDQVFAADLHFPLRPHPGQAVSADNMRRLMAGSGILASHRDSTHLVQDAYSMRCAPQVTGAARDALTFATQVAERELLAAVDNPVVRDDGSVSSNGNFHGAPLAHALDFLAIVAADVANISERRTDRIMDPHRNNGLHPFLADDPGVDSGLMIAHYTQAAMVSECKRLAAPASVDSIPSSAMQEDHVSMGWSAARKLRQVVDNLARVLAVELTAGAWASAMRAPHASSAPLAAAREVVGRASRGVGPDRFLSPELREVAELVASGAVLEAVQGVAGPLDGSALGPQTAPGFPVRGGDAGGQS